MSRHLPDRAVGSTIPFTFTTHASAGGNVSPSTAFEAADIRIYKDGSATQRSSSAGITMTSPFDSLTGVHNITIDLSDNTDAGFYATGHYYEVMLVPNDETIDSQTVNQVIFSFDIYTKPTVADVVAAVFARVFSSAYGSKTFDEIVKGVAAVLLGKASGLSGTTATYRNLNDDADVVVATVDANGNRTAVTFTP